jgi:hypothetical protein
MLMVDASLAIGFSRPAKGFELQQRNRSKDAATQASPQKRARSLVRESVGVLNVVRAPISSKPVSG